MVSVSAILLEIIISHRLRLRRDGDLVRIESIDGVVPGGIMFLREKKRGILTSLYAIISRPSVQNWTDNRNMSKHNNNSAPHLHLNFLLARLL